VRAHATRTCARVHAYERIESGSKRCQKAAKQRCCRGGAYSNCARKRCIKFSGMLSGQPSVCSPPALQFETSGKLGPSKAKAAPARRRQEQRSLDAVGQIRR
jgi:hypothetical protein